MLERGILPFILTPPRIPQVTAEDRKNPLNPSLFRTSSLTHSAHQEIKLLKLVSKISFLKQIFVFVEIPTIYC